MSINYAILGFLGHTPMTGYDLKKVMQDSPFMHWSGNNNQIYKALTDLSESNFVTNEVQEQRNAPAKKIYTITEEGLAALKEWTLSKPELPEIKKAFLVQLAWTDLLNDQELEVMLNEYETQIKEHIEVNQKDRAKGYFSPGRSDREKIVWEMIYDNALQSFESELKWIDRLRKALAEGEIVAENLTADTKQGEFSKLIDYTIKVASAIEEQQVLNTNFQSMLRGFDREVGLKPGETI